MKKYPMLMKPAFKRALWGGYALKSSFNKNADFDDIAESWELSARTGAESTVGNGVYKGMTLLEFLQNDGYKEHFPLLIKLIDAKSCLSVQVHPGAEEFDGSLPLEKNELWYVIYAKPGAEIVYGVKNGVSADDLVRRGNIEGCLRRISVKTGDAVFIPSGQIHSLGDGITVAEIQQNSDTTYRLYDYNRRDENGKLRELHLEKALSALHIRTDKEIDRLRFMRGKSKGCLADCRQFGAYLRGDGTVFNMQKKFRAVTAVNGSGVLCCEGKEYSIETADTYFLPLHCPDCMLRGNVTVIEAYSNL